jgi:hypothetical protein
MTRTMEEDLSNSLVGCTVEEVRFDPRTGLAMMRCSKPRGDEAIFCFNAENFADADRESMWNRLR